MSVLIVLCEIPLALIALFYLCYGIAAVPSIFTSIRRNITKQSSTKNTTTNK